MNRLREERIADILDEHFSDIEYSKRQHMTPLLARDFDGRDRLGDVERIARRLTLASSAYFLGLAEPLAPNDARLNAKVGAVRAALQARSLPPVRAELAAARDDGRRYGAPTAAAPAAAPARDEAGKFVAARLYPANPM